MHKNRPEKSYADLARGTKSLCTAILKQALLDYKDLNEKDVVSYRDKSGKYSKDEIERFLKSDWCGKLLGHIGGSFTGEYILSCLQTRKSEN